MSKRGLTIITTLLILLGIILVLLLIGIALVFFVGNDSSDSDMNLSVGDSSQTQSESDTQVSGNPGDATLPTDDGTLEDVPPVDPLTDNNQSYGDGGLNIAPPEDAPPVDPLVNSGLGEDNGHMLPAEY